MVLTIAGCSSGILQLGPDLYRVSVEGMTLGGTEAEAVKQAGAHCAAMGKQISTQGMQSEPMRAYSSYATAAVTFRCVPPTT